MPAEVRAILLTGPVGAGKTTVALALGELLEQAGLPYALVELDWLAWARPAAASEVTLDELLAENLRAVLPGYRRAGIERLVLTRMLERDEQLDAIRAALAGVPLVVVALTAPPAVLEARLRARDTGAELAQHLELLHAPGVEGDVTVESDGEPEEIARTILERAKWTPEPPKAGG